jgi:hypothetical protein
MTLDFFTNYILPPLIIIIGLFGNTMGIIVVSRKALKNIGPKLIYKFLFIEVSLISHFDISRITFQLYHTNFRI